MELKSRVICTGCVVAGYAGKKGTVTDVIPGITGKTLTRYEVKFDDLPNPLYLLEGYNIKEIKEDEK